MKPFRHFLLTVTLLAGLSLPAAAQLIPSIDNPARNWAQGISCGRDTDVDDFLQYFPLAANVGLGFLVPAKHELKERVVLSLTATATMEALVYSTKHIVRIPRPDSGRRNSFPSGHTGMAFVGAELVRAEYGWGYGAAAYAVAATTGFLRMYNDRHWLSDVVVGAAAGVLSARIAYLLLPVERRLLGWDDDKATLIVPYVAPRACGVSLAMTF